jgi:GT2 family glycosyltransferase
MRGAQTDMTPRVDVPAARPSDPPRASFPGIQAPRPETHGKFFRVGEDKLYLRGVTYGPFSPGADGDPYDRGRTHEDFARMFEAGVNTVRLYTPPPDWLLDEAADAGLFVLAGVAWEQHIAFLDEPRRARSIIRRVRSEVRDRTGHPALMAWAIGNEIPAPIVRWHHPEAVRSFLARLYHVAKEADPGGLITYVNYPTTEYLELDFLDFVCFNVFLERQRPFEDYLLRLQNLAGDRPLVVTEIGLDSSSHGEQAQADAIDWQVRTAFAAGCAGAFVFSWTDEWHRGGAEITDWQFGLTDRDRTPKPALARLRAAFESVPLDPGASPPRVSLVICTYNGARTLEETCAAVSRLAYPNVEVIVVDDGSTDDSALIAERHGFRVISTANRGLSSARNAGLAAAGGEIVAFIDDDAMPDPHWLTYLVETFAQSRFVAVGGPNLPVPGDGAVADAVAAAPGNPVHVLLSDSEAEHIPGCNSAFRADALRAVGGFDPRFRTAGDDVDVCWRLMDEGWRIGYSPAAVVWHHRRPTVRGYLRQQRGYGRAEALLERKWPARYSAGGHVTWRGRLYGESAPRHASGVRRWRVYHGVWGSAPFQALYEPARGDLNAFTLMPEVYLAIGLAALLVALGALWTPLLFLAPAVVVAAGGLAMRAAVEATTARFPTGGLSRRQALARRFVTGMLHIVQPLVRMEGRLRHGLSPWRRYTELATAWPVPRSLERWSESWADPNEWARSFERGITAAGAVVRRGGPFDRWDLEIRGGVLAGVRVITAVEEHAGGHQLIRSRCRPIWSRAAVGITALLLALAVTAAIDGAAVAGVLLAALGAAVGLRAITEASSALAVTMRVLRQEAL